VWHNCHNFKLIVVVWVQSGLGLSDVVVPIVLADDLLSAVGVVLVVKHLESVAILAAAAAVVQLVPLNSDGVLSLASDSRDGSHWSSVLSEVSRDNRLVASVSVLGNSSHSVLGVHIQVVDVLLGLVRVSSDDIEVGGLAGLAIVQLVFVIVIC